ncbi:PD-(D/E)XK nuclease family protein [Pendulispora albinea]|uniref:PD-(D/E)XK nuclease family protein n=1 Tax=Pendulispora albinea TaxID=2741071 RepID=A0ABZ2LS54_9BACT
MTRLIVPTERHVERLSREGVPSETRTALKHRLLEALAPDVTLASPEVTRLALADALAAVAPDDPLLGPIARGGSHVWLKTVDSVDAAIAALRACDAQVQALERMEAKGGTLGRRARMLRSALVALDRALGAMGLVDGRSAGAALAAALGAADPSALVDLVGSAHLVARWIVVWEPSDLAWWRALDRALERAGGSAKLELPSFESPLDATRDRDPLEILFDDMARAFDAPPETFRIEPVLGDLRLSGPVPQPERISIRQAADVEVQARAVADAIDGELAAGTPIESLAVALPQLDEHALEPLRRAVGDLGIPVHDPRGPAPTASAIVARALDAHALASRGLPRHDVARLLRSRYVDAVSLTGEGEPIPARQELLRLAAVLEQTPTARGADPVEELEATARAGASKARFDARAPSDTLGPLARRVGEILWKASRAQTRLEHIRAARELWSALGFPARVGFDARATLARDEVPTGLARAELHALARDAHAWRVLMETLDRYEAAVHRLNDGGVSIGMDAFRHELVRALEAGDPPPGARRIGALRIARVADLAHESLACLVIASANEGNLPVLNAHPALLFESFVAGLREIDPARSPAPQASIAARGMAQLALAAAGAKKLVFVYCTSDAEGAALSPAPLVAWLARGGAAEKSWPVTPLRARPLTARDARLRLLARDPARGVSVVPDAARRARIELARESFHGTKSAHYRGPLTGFLELDTNVARAITEDTGGAARPLPVTSLERFARCAFQGFAGHVLGAREKEEASDVPDARQSGTLVHEALAAAFVATLPLWRERPRDAEGIRALAFEAADRVLARERVASALRRMALEETRDDVRKVIDFSLGDESYDFELAERSFGDGREGTWPPLRFEQDGVAISIRGTIDRVDRSPDGTAIRIVDYKRGARTAKDAQREVTKSVYQVPLYALIAREVLGARYADGMYLPTHQLDRTYSTSAYASAWAEAMGDGPSGVVARTLAVVRAVRDGAVGPAPDDPKVCDRCPYDGGCRRPRFVASEEDEQRSDSPGARSGGGGGGW